TARIGRERERQLVMFAKLAMALLGVARDADDRDPGPLELGEAVAERTCLLGAARGLVFRIEVHDREMPRLRAQARRLAVRAGRAEVGRGLADRQEPSFYPPRVAARDRASEHRQQQYFLHRALTQWVVSVQMRVARRCGSKPTIKTGSCLSF